MYNVKTALCKIIRLAVKVLKIFYSNTNI